MSTVLTVKEKGLEVILIQGSPWDTSALTIHAYVVKDVTDVDEDDSNVVLVGDIALGELATVEIELPCFFERAGVVAGASYPLEIVADKDGDNPIVISSGNDCYVRIEEVASL